jgi:ADP-heptose:LPS heptosyltransferase
VARLLGADGRRPVVLHPGSGDNFPGRRWSPAGFAAVGRAATARGVPVVVTGAVGERALTGAVAHRVGPGAVDAGGRLSVEGLVALVARARAVVTNDTAPVHLASALGTPTLALYGPNTPSVYGPLAPRSQAFYRPLPCSPCLTAARYRSSRCRLPTCIQSVPAGAVAAALVRLLETGTVSAEAMPCDATS